MQLRIYLFIQWLILFFQHNFVVAKALIGQNVRAARQGHYTFAACFTERLPKNQLTVNKIFCTGAAVTKLHVLLAAHCTEHKQKNETQLIIGSIHILNGKIYYPFWWINFQEWSAFRRKSVEFKVNDIAVIRVTEPLANNIQPIPISQLENTELYGKNVKAVGWGITNEGVATMDLQVMDAKVLSISECQSRIKNAHGIKVGIQKTNFCTVANPFALLQPGDSGGPLLYHNTIVAINKATIPSISNNNEHKVNTHIGIEYYRPFITFVTHETFMWY